MPAEPVLAEPVSNTLRIAVTLEQCWHRVPGGTAMSAIRSCDALARRSDVELVGVAARHAHPPDAPWVPPIPVRQLPLPRPLLYESWHRFRRPAVDRVTGAVDVIHATGMAVPPRTAPLVVTVHDLAFVHHPDHSTRRGHRFFLRSLELARREADLVICPSQATLDDCVANGIDERRLRLVPWGVDVPEVVPERAQAVRRELGLSRPYVLWSGTIEPRKNLPVLLEAFAGLARDDVDLVLAGPKGWNEDALSTSPAVASIGARLRVLGFLPDADLAAVHAGAEVFCYPSLREGFGLPVLEAMAHGVPVVTSVDSPMAEVADGAATLVDPRDPVAVRRAIEALLDDEVLHGERARRAREQSATFTWDRTAELLVAVYREVAA